MRTTGLALLGVLFAFNVDGGVAWAENGVPVQLTRDDITAVRSKLRDLDYDVKPAGALDDAVRSAIREFLKNIGEPPADFLTSEQLARLKAIDTSSYLYAAVAASTDGKYAVVWNRKGHDQAESEAMSGCAAKSSKSDKCTVIARADATKEGWVAAVNCKRKDGRTTHTAVGLGGSRGRDRAIEVAYSSARDMGQERKDCWLTAVVEASGLHLLAEPGKGNSPELSIAYANRGAKRLARDETDDAIADFDQAIRLDPKLSKAYFGRGQAWDKKANLDKALADYDQAIRLGLNDSPVYASRGWVRYKKNDVDRAITDYNEAIRLDPKPATTYVNRGVALDKKGELDRAISDYDQAIRLSPNFALAFNDRGYAWSKKGDLDRAIADYNEAIRLDPNGSRAYHNRIEVWKKKGDTDRVVADFDQLIRINPKNVANYFNRGWTLLNSGALPKALADFNQASELNPSDGYAALALDIAGWRSHLPSRLTDATARVDMTKWPAPVIRLYLGQLTAEAALAAADDPNPETKKGFICEANFYSGDFALRREAKSDGLRFLRAAVADCPKSFVEYEGAVAALKALGEKP